MNQLVVRVEAEEEMLEGFDWYEGRAPGVGPKFLDQVERLFEEILSSPLRYPVVHCDVRMALVRTFPYAIFYRSVGDRIVVYSVFHTSRDPDIWKFRINN